MNIKKHLVALSLLAASGVTAGELPSVTFTGGSYVQTPITPTVNLRVVCEFELLEAPTGDQLAGVFGSLGQTTNNLNTGWGLRAHGPNNKGTGAWGGSFIGWSGNDGQILGPIDTARHTLELASGRIVFDGVTTPCGESRDPVTSNGGGLGAFDIGDQGWRAYNALPKMRLYSMQFYRTVDEVENLVYNLKPWELEGVCGLYDTVEKKFYPALGTENLLPGWWTRRPSVTPTRWNRRAGVTPVIDLGAVTNAATVTCSHTAAQLAALPVGSHCVTFTTASEDVAIGGRELQVVVTVEEAFSGAAEDGEGRIVDLTFPPAAEERTLHLVYGKTDQGTNLAAWEHCVDVSVPAGTDTLQVTAPEGFGEENPVWTALLPQPAAAKNARSYVRYENLVLQWDGEENAAYGQHDASRSFPAEIRQGLPTFATSGYMTAAAKSFMLGDGYFQLRSSLLQNLINRGRATVEVTLEHGANVNNGGIFAMGNTSRGFWYYQKVDGTTPYYPGDLSYHARMRDDYECYRSGSAAGANTLAFVLGANSNACYLAENGAKLMVHHSQASGLINTYKFQRYGKDVQDDILSIGILPGDWFNNGAGPKARAKVSSIRVYDRVLTPDEIQANAAVDAVRFRGRNLEQVGPFFAEVPLTVAKVNKENRIPVSADLLFTGASVSRRVYFVWDTQDRGTSFSAWENAVLAGTVPPGVAAATVPIPAEAREGVAKSGGFRFFLEDAVSAADYVQGEHLVAQFDGIENGGFGMHDATRTAPAELRHNLAVTATGKLDVGEKTFRLGAHSFSFACPALQTAVNEGHATVELVMATNGFAAVNNGGYFCIGNDWRGFWFYQKAAYAGDLSYHAKQTGEYDTLPSMKFTGTNTFSFVLGNSTETSFAACDDVKQTAMRSGNVNIGTTIDRFTTATTDDQCFVGVLPGSYIVSNYRPQVLVYSIRLYDCILTDDERARNRMLDRHRFCGELVCSTASAYTRGASGGLTVIVR